MFYVLNFDLLFSLDPERIGWWTFVILSSVIFVPNIGVGIYLTQHGQYVDATVGLLTRQDKQMDRISFAALYVICWTVLFLLLSSIAFIFVPLFYKKRQLPSHSGHVQPQRTISLQRYLLGSLGFLSILVISFLAVNFNDNRRPLSTVFYFIFAIFVLLLTYHLTEKDARGAARKYLFNLFNIVEDINNFQETRAFKLTEYSMRQPSSALAAGLSMAVVTPSPISFPATRQIEVAALNCNE